MITTIFNIMKHPRLHFIFFLICTIFNINSYASLVLEESRESLSTIKTSQREIEVITDPAKPPLYSIGVMLCSSPGKFSSQWAMNIQSIYDTNKLPLHYIDKNRFWEIPHITLGIYKNISFEHIHHFKEIYDLLQNESLSFEASSVMFMGRGDVLVAMPTVTIDKKAKELNELINRYVRQSSVLNEGDKLYQIDRNTQENRFKPHLSLNTTVDFTHRGKIKRVLTKKLSALCLELNHISITATNEW